MKLCNITLLGIDCVNVERLQAVMDISQKEIEFGQVKLLTSLPTDDSRAVKIPHIGSVEEYSRFCIEDLYKYIDTDFVLLVQYDGFILNPDKWSDEFLGYDYIGAPWLVGNWSVRDFDFPKEMLGKLMVGNGGFSIRSRKLLETSAKLAREGKILRFHPEDTSICVWHKTDMENEGIRFAPPELARKFSLEGEYFAYGEQFGFHSFEWTDVGVWIAEHPEYPLFAKEYKKGRARHFRRLRARSKAALKE